MDKPRRTPATVATVLVAALGAVAALYAWFVLTDSGQRLDADLFATIADAAAAHGLVPAMGLVRDVLPWLGSALAVALGVVQLRRGRWRLVTFTATAAGGSTLLSTALRGWLPRPDYGNFIYPYNTFPSGHVAAVTALCVAIRILWPTTAPRWLDAALAGAVLLAAWASVDAFAHRPSDVLAAPFVVAAAFSALALLVDRFAWSVPRGARDLP